MPAIASATSTRRRAEFAAGRAVLRDALALAGLDHDGPLPGAPSGEAVLPDGYVHSLSHTHSASGILACAVVGSAAAEGAERLPPRSCRSRKAKHTQKEFWK